MSSLNINLSVLKLLVLRLSLGRQFKYFLLFAFAFMYLEYLTLPYISLTRKLDLFFRMDDDSYTLTYISVSTERRNTCFPYFFSVRLAAPQWDGSSKVPCISLFCPGVWSLGSFETAAEWRTCVCHWQKLMRYLKAVKLPHKIASTAPFPCKFKHGRALLNRRLRLSET